MPKVPAGHTTGNAQSLLVLPVFFLGTVLAGLSDKSMRKKTSKGTVSRSPKQISGVKCLIVDDHRAQLDAWQELLTMWGFEVDTADSLKVALNRARSGGYSFALLDYLLGDVVGAPNKIMKVLAKNSPQCNVFVMTAYSAEAQATMDDKLGCSTVIRKPVDPIWLRKKLDNELVKVK